MFIFNMYNFLKKGAKAVMFFVLPFACVCIPSISAQDFRKYGAYAPYAADSSLLFQPLPRFQEMEQKKISPIPAPRFDATSVYRESTYRAFDAMEQPNVRISKYNEKKFSRISPLSAIGAQTFSPVKENGYAPFAPFAGFQE